MLYFSLQVPVKIRVIGESAWSHGPCIVGKMNMLASDTVYYYRHIFTVVGSLIAIAVVTFYGNILCIFVLFLVLRKDLNLCMKIISKYMLLKYNL